MHIAVKKLTEFWPETLNEIEEDKKALGEDYPNREHSVFAQSFNPRLMRIMEMGHEKEIKEVFEFIEQLTSINEETENLVAVTICERLADNPEFTKTARRYMGKNTLRLMDNMDI